MEVAGVDGCKDGWLVVRVDATDQLRLLDLSIAPTFDDLIASTRHCKAVAVDIPIGLSEDGRREPDIEARRVLSPLRHNSVFPAPVRAVLGARSYEEACAISEQVSGKKMSKQAYFGLLSRVRDADHAMSPILQKRVVEVHPEVSFWKLNGEQTLSHSKSKRAGEEERLRLLSQAFGDELAATAVPEGAKPDDFYDSCVAAWTASRVAYGTAQRLPLVPPLDSRGLRMEIVY